MTLPRLEEIEVHPADVPGFDWVVVRRDDRTDRFLVPHPVTWASNR